MRRPVTPSNGLNRAMTVRPDMALASMTVPSPSRSSIAMAPALKAFLRLPIATLPRLRSAP